MAVFVSTKLILFGKCEINLNIIEVQFPEGILPKGLYLAESSSFLVLRRIIGGPMCMRTHGDDVCKLGPCANVFVFLQNLGWGPWTHGLVSYS